MDRLVIASNNRSKISEIKDVLKETRIRISSRLDYKGLRKIPETGSSYFENAFIKAKAVWEFTGIPSLADDSGLEVKALGGKPGIFSARYSGPKASDMDNRKKLLNELKEISKEKRAAEFICVLVLYDGNETHIFEGRCRGEIAFEERGCLGFGYDSIFIPEGYNLTFAEMKPELKQAISHRGKALSALLKYLRFKVIDLMG